MHNKPFITCFAHVEAKVATRSADRTSHGKGVSLSTSCRVVIEYFLYTEPMLPSVLLVRTLHSSWISRTNHALTNCIYLQVRFLVYGHDCESHDKWIVAIIVMSTYFSEYKGKTQRCWTDRSLHVQWTIITLLKMIQFTYWHSSLRQR